MNATETKKWASNTFATFTVVKDGYLPKSNLENTKKAISLGFIRIAYRTNTERQWSQNIPAKTSYEQLMLRVSDEKLFTLTGNILTDWAERFNANCERITI
jgi:hypothetical protein